MPQTAILGRAQKLRKCHQGKRRLRTVIQTFKVLLSIFLVTVDIVFSLLFPLPFPSFISFWVSTTTCDGPPSHPAQIHIHQQLSLPFHSRLQQVYSILTFQKRLKLLRNYISNIVLVHQKKATRKISFWNSIII